MNLYDRIQATIRCPQYLDQLESLYRTLQDKYGEKEEPAPIKFVRYLIKVYNVPEGRQLAEHWQLPTVIDPRDPEDKHLLASWTRAASNHPRKTAYPIGARRLKKDRYLHLKVDLWERADILSFFFRECVKYHKAQLPSELLPQGRDKDTSLDPWEIYDQVHKFGKKKFQVFRECFNTNKHPSMSQEAKNQYKQVESAYRKALQCIHEAGAAHSIPSTPQTLNNS